MIKFFRKIRQKLLSENRFSKYLLYAIGEILLVVIGILIALQLNERKENVKHKAIEIKLLTELHNDLEETEKRFTSYLEWEKKFNFSKQVVIDVIDHDIPWHDSLQTHFNLFNFWNSYSISSSAYNSIENWGINNISNDSIRRQIVNIFQNEVYTLAKMERNEGQVRLSSLNDILSTQFDWSNINKVSPVNYEALLMNEELALRLKAYKTFTLLGINNRITLLKKIKSVKISVLGEIERLKDL